jgi:hypothetical protein
MKGGLVRRKPGCQFKSELKNNALEEMYGITILVFHNITGDISIEVFLSTQPVPEGMIRFDS